MNRGTMLVLGGGSGQLPLIRRMKDSGIRIVLQDRNPFCSGRPLADEFVEADTFDGEAASRAARRFTVDGVCTAGTDQPVLAAAQAAERRGCPALIDAETARGVTDKEVMKGLLAEAGIPIPRYRILSNEPPNGRDVPENLRFPLVLKPVDSQGQRGVLRVDRPDEFPSAYNEAMRWSRRKHIIAEEYHPNREITVSGWVHRGEPTIWAATDRVTRDFPPHIGLCLAHRYPSVYAAGRSEDIHRLTVACVRALGLENGPLYFQYLATGTGLLVNECAARLGGAYEDISLPPVCGNDPLSLLIAGSLAGRADPRDSIHAAPRTAGSFAVPLMFCRPGTIAVLEGTHRVNALPGVSAFSFLLEPGTSVLPPRNSVQRAAFLVAHGATPKEVNRVLHRAWPRLAVRDESGRQLLRKTLGYAVNPLG